MLRFVAQTYVCPKLDASGFSSVSCGTMQFQTFVSALLLLSVLVPSADSLRIQLSLTYERAHQVRSTQGRQGVEECVGFPGRSLKNWSQSSIQPDVLLSISMFEEPWYLRATVENALKHTLNSTVIILHLNSNSSMPLPSDQNHDFDWIWAHPRVEVNCNRIEVHRMEGSILESQISNVQWARSRGINAQFIVFQASNMWWARPGMEAHVHAKQVSIPRILTEKDCNRFVHRHRHAFQECHTLLEDSLSLRFPTPLRICQRPPFADIQFVVQRKHEGSYYPALELHDLIDHLEDVIRNGGRQFNNPHCPDMAPNVYDTKHCVEEFVFQTWFANQARVNGTGGDVMCLFADEVGEAGMRGVTSYDQKTKQAQVPQTCEQLRSYFSDPGLFAVKFHELRSTEWQRQLLATCVV
eukprot:gnl/TRDRNA2_/TRDRNA2_148988_c7_seq1.p1 gnl/TRDRNA2_/TRDRNA2_148988_c7~~gnl/TRDRNA2_/TRDRNA2_148988_c7_seq1.p1  ORF type:complete len:411 (-),score=39.16 gnl/TRDRNA2_/TRDRNA2_148988_c7_seq1:25-1257(-)